MLSTLAPYIGYAASALLMIGLLVTTDLKFRIWNGLGCLVFIIYALIIHAFPVLVTNVVLLTINIVYFIKIIKRKELFDTCDFHAEDALALKFINFYKDDIKSYFPNFTAADLTGNLNVVVLRDLVVANMFSGKLQSDGNLIVNLNYTVPKYRDYKVGKFLFDEGKMHLTEKGVLTVLYNNVSNKNHHDFLVKSGFKVSSKGGKEKMEKDLQ